MAERAAGQELRGVLPHYVPGTVSSWNLRDRHYFEARLPRQFDAVMHFDETHAVEPVDRTPGWDLGEPPDTYPTGL